MPRIGQRIPLPLALVVVTALAVLVVGHGLGQSAPGYAAQLTPPAPPTYVPTPIGPPPNPPTFTPGPAASGTPGPTPSTTMTPTAAVFSLDAARVSRVGNKGDLSGLASAKPGSRVWLMMYYTVRQLPPLRDRITTYTITYKGKTVYSIGFHTKLKSSELGRRSRYDVYDIPKTLPYGPYVYRATLAIGGVVQHASWKFSLGRQERLASTGGH